MRPGAVSGTAFVAQQAPGLNRLPTVKPGREGVQVTVADEVVATAGGPDVDDRLIAEAAAQGRRVQSQDPRRPDLADRSPEGAAEVDAGVEVSEAVGVGLAQQRRGTEALGDRRGRAGRARRGGRPEGGGGDRGRPGGGAG